MSETKTNTEQTAIDNSSISDSPQLMREPSPEEIEAFGKMMEDQSKANKEPLKKAKDYSYEEILNLDPLEMNSELFHKYQLAQKRVLDMGSINIKALAAQVEHSELDARHFKANRDIKQYNLDSMKATIEIEELVEKYQASVQKTQARMEKAQKDSQKLPEGQAAGGRIVTM